MKPTRSISRNSQCCVLILILWALFFVPGVVRAEVGRQKNAYFDTSARTLRLLDTEAAKTSPRISGPYSEKYALLWSYLSTGAAVGIGGGLLIGGLSGNVDSLTWAGAVTLSMGFTVPPSLGHLYARNTKRGLIMSGVRLALVAAGLIPQIVYHSACEGEGCAFARRAHLIFVVPLASLISVGLAIADLMTVRRSVRRANNAYRERLDLRF